MQAGDGGDDLNSGQVCYWNYELWTPFDQNHNDIKIWTQSILKENLVPSPKHKVKVNPAPQGLATSTSTV